MNILNDLLDSLDMDVPVRTVLVGVHWTVVCSRVAGLASTLIGDKPHGHDQVRNVGHLHEKMHASWPNMPALTTCWKPVLVWPLSTRCSPWMKAGAVEVNAVDVLIEHGLGKNVALVGHFPFIPKLRPVVGQLWVIEQHPGEENIPLTPPPI